MLLEREIDRRMRRVRGIHLLLALHGMEVIREDLPTATTTFTPSNAPAVATPREVAPSKSASPAPEPSTSEPRSLAPSIEPGESPESPQEPHVVTLHWYGRASGCSALDGPVVTILSVLGRRYPDTEDVPLFYQLWDWNDDHGGGGESARGETTARADERGIRVVLWQETSRQLELQADLNFSTATVKNSLARVIGLDFAKMLLLHLAEDAMCPEEFRPRPRPDHPDVIRFFARLKANMKALLDNACSAPASYSIAPPHLSSEIKNGLREAVVETRHPKLWKKNAAPTVAAPATASFPLDDGKGSPSDSNASPVLVLRSFDDLFCGISDREIIDAFKNSSANPDQGGSWNIRSEKGGATRRKNGVICYDFNMRAGMMFG